MKSFKNAVVLAGSMVVAAAAHAQATTPTVDTTAVIAGIGSAQTAILAVIGALTSLSVAIFGVAKVYAFIKRKAGA